MLSLISTPTFILDLKNNIEIQVLDVKNVIILLELKLLQNNFVKKQENIHIKG